MTWQIINTEPQYGICDQCKSHQCGILPDGTQKWIVTGLLDRVGDAHVVGYRCVELWAQNLGISKVVMEKVIELPPSDEQVLRLMRASLDNNNVDFNNMLQPVSITSQGKPIRSRKQGNKP